MKVVVVDADADTRQSLVMALQALGHQVVDCDGGARALSATLREEFDLAICALELPDLPGTEVVRAIKMQAPALVAWMVAEAEPSTWAPAAVEAGAARCLRKPLHHATLRAELEAMVGGGAVLDVVLAVADRHLSRTLGEPFKRARCTVSEAHRIAEFLARLGERGADVVVVDGALPQARLAVTTCRLKLIPCVVLADDARDPVTDGASCVMARDSKPDAVLDAARNVVHR